MVQHVQDSFIQKAMRQEGFPPLVLNILPPQPGALAVATLYRYHLFYTESEPWLVLWCRPGPSPPRFPCAPGVPVCSDSDYSSCSEHPGLCCTARALLGLAGEQQFLSGVTGGEVPEQVAGLWSSCHISRTLHRCLKPLQVSGGAAPPKEKISDLLYQKEMFSVR